MRVAAGAGRVAGRCLARGPCRLIGLLVLSILLGVPGAATAAADEAGPLLRGVVGDIISFTRWPEPRALLRLCVVGQPAYGQALLASDVQAGGVLVHGEPMGVGDERLGALCDVIYEGPVSPAEREQVGRATLGHPVLTIGEAAPGCVERTMFCLQTGGLAAGAVAGGPPVPFSSNLDAIARSGVRLNPRVLLLGRRTPVR